ncbi:MAG: hypothetical protein CMN32_02890 [Saprospirales bacterium]|nr:hypothetical protein [Saprospirales bacterium]
MRLAKTLFFLALATLFGSLQAQTVYKAQLTGRHEVLPVASAGSGEITATLTGNALVVTGFFENLSAAYDATVAGGAHLHIGYAGQTGGILFTLTPALDADLKGGTFAAALNTFTLTAEQMAWLQQRRIYVNIHTTAHASGELRGQLLPEADTYMVCNLFGTNHLPPVTTEGSGSLMLELDNDQLVVTGSFDNLSSDFAASIAGGAHLHFGLPGTAGGIAVALNATVDADLRSGVFEAANNTFTLTSDQVSALLQRNAYANIHTMANTSGELRGQVTGTAQAVFRAMLTGSQEWPVVTSAATGLVQAELQGNTLIVSGAFGGLESDVATSIAGGAHLHIGPPGANGGVAVALDATLDADLRGGIFEPSSNTFTLTNDQVASLLDRQCYVNIHTIGNMAGEIRGQLMLEAQAYFMAFLNGGQELPDVNTTGHGMIIAELSGDKLTCVGSFDDLQSAVNVAIAGGAHLHLALPGRSGDVAFPLMASLDGDLMGGVFTANDNTFTLDAAQKSSLEARAFYANIHTIENPGGEVRGNLMAEATMYFMVPLSGASQTLAVNTAANGMIILEVLGDSCTAVGAFNDLSGAFDASVAGGAHLHYGMAGENGGIALFLDAQTDADLMGGIFSAGDNRFQLSAGLLDTLRLRGLYANIHTMTHAAGELRGQCLPLAGNYFHTSLLGLNEADPFNTEASGSLKFELTGMVLTCTGSFAALQGQFDASVAGGSHLHIAPAGQSGSIAVTLVPQLSADMSGGVYLAADNTFELTEEQADALRAGQFYVNIHTTAAAAGELRGQVLPEVNLYPEPSSLLLPLPGAIIDLQGAASTLLSIECLPATDPDGDPVNYIWQVALDADFNNVIYMQNANGLTAFTATYGDLDAALEAASISVGTQVTLYHRIVVTDGSNATPGQSQDAQFARGNVTGLREVLATRFRMDAYPTVFSSNSPTVSISADENAEADLLLFDNFGRIVGGKPVALVPGMQTLSLDTESLAPGTYYVALRMKGKILPPRMLIKQ